MPPQTDVAIPLGDLTLRDARTGAPVALGGLLGVHAVVCIRHRF